jgi:hypothetical protein
VASLPASTRTATELTIVEAGLPRSYAALERLLRLPLAAR